MSIESSLSAAVGLSQAGQYEEAMALACVALDATAAAEGRGSKPTARCREFIKANLDIITNVWFSGTLTVKAGIDPPKLKDPRAPERCVSVDKIILGAVRGSVIHGASLPEGAFFTTDAFYGERDNGEFHIPVALIYGLIVAVLASPKNASHRFGTDVVITRGERRLELEHLWGRPDLVREQLGIHELFPA